MSATENTPTNLNFLTPLGFNFFIKKLPTTNFFLQRVTVPGLQGGIIPEMPTPLTAIPYSHDHVTFNEFMIEFCIDEDMKNYIEVYNWIRGLGFPENYQEYRNLARNTSYSGLGLKSDATLTITTNSKKANKTLIFEDVFPVSLSDINFDVTLRSTEYITARASFRYTQYKFA